MTDQDYFWEGVDVGKILFQRCTDCGTVRQFPPQPMCPKCQSLEWQPHEVAGRGAVRAWIVSRHPSKPDAEPRIVILVELAEGLRLVSNLQGTGSEAVRLGMPVEAVFKNVDGVFLHQFRANQTGATVR